MKQRRNLIVGVILGTATTLAVLTSVISGENESTPPPAAPLTEVDSSPTVPAGQEPCAYQWAYQDMPELTTSFATSLKKLDENAKGFAQAFGENCLRSDGSSEFLAMETDFYVQLPVEDLKDEEKLGNWIAQVMDVVLQIPPEELQGPKSGFVEFSFSLNDAERTVVRVPLEDYKQRAQSMKGLELFQAFYTPQP